MVSVDSFDAVGQARYLIECELDYTHLNVMVYRLQDPPTTANRTKGAIPSLHFNGRDLLGTMRQKLGLQPEEIPVTADLYFLVELADIERCLHEDYFPRYAEQLATRGLQNQHQLRYAARFFQDGALAAERQYDSQFQVG